MPQVGLLFDLSSWKKGVRKAGSIVKKGVSSKLLSPFDKAVKKSVKGMKTLFSGLGKFIKGVLTSAFAPLLALFAVGAIISTIKNTLTGSLGAYREYSDSVTTLQAALQSVNETDVDGATESVKKLGEQLRLSMGITAAETNNAFANFITRGFDVSQARQLTILAANYAKKSGKPIADVQKQIADAANGEIGAIKELGIQINATGDKTKDAEAAVIALKGAYGDIGADLANPSERLAAAFNQLGVTLGEKISPILEPIIQGFSDFVTGLTQTEEGQKLLDGIANTLKTMVERTLWFIKAISNLVEMVKSSGSVIWNYLNKLFNDIMATLLEKLRELPGGDWLLEKMGFDPEHAADGFREGAAEFNKALGESMTDFSKAQDDFINGRADQGAAGYINRIREAGKEAREDAAKSLPEEIASTKNEGFAGDPAKEAEEKKKQEQEKRREEEERKKWEKDQEERKKALDANNKRVAGYASANAGQQVSVQIKSTKPDRFRRSRVR